MWPLGGGLSVGQKSVKPEQMSDNTKKTFFEEAVLKKPAIFQGDSRTALQLEDWF